jgi:hypothetical protein
LSWRNLRRLLPESLLHQAGDYAAFNFQPLPLRHQNDRKIALTRKNALFAGCDQGAANWAAVASLIETCKLNGVDPQAYIEDVLTKLVNLWPASRIDDLMPWAWARAQNSTERIAA